MESRPLLYMKPRLENTAASPAQIRHVCFHLETAIALMPEGVQNLAILIDFSGSSMRTNPGVAVAREIINVLGSHYPERLGKAYIIHGKVLQEETWRVEDYFTRMPPQTKTCLFFFFCLFSALVLLPVLQADLTIH